MEREALWRLVVDIKYDGLREGWCAKEVGGSFGVGVWKYTRREWEGFSKFVRYEVADGTKVWFWHDVWCGEQPLKFSFSELFTISLDKDAWVVDHLQFHNGNIHWNIVFIGSVHDWKGEVVFVFFELDSQRVRQGSEDTICWIPSKRKSFEVKFYYQVLSILISSPFL